MDQDAKPTIVFIPLKWIIRSESNPRTHFDEAKLAELADSIRNHGVLQPILVRPISHFFVEPGNSSGKPGFFILDRRRFRKGGTDYEGGFGELYETAEKAERERPQYELVAGERRWRASGLAGLGEIPCFVRELTDKQVLEIQCVENLQRDDLNPIEEANGYQKLVNEYSYTVEELAARLGRSKSYVYQRLRLAGLPDEAKDAVTTGAIPASTALLIARLPAPKDREKATNLILHPEAWKNGGRPLSYTQAKDVIEQNFHLLLANASFPVDKADLLEGVPDCSSCPKKAGNQPELFADVRNADSCTDPKCFARKGDAWWEHCRKEAVANGLTVLDSKEAKKYIRSWGLSGNTFVHPGDICYQISGGKTWADLLGEDCPPSTLARAHGKIHELIDKKAAMEVLARKHPEFTQQENQENAHWQEQRRKEREKEEIDKRAGELAILGIIEEVEIQKKIGTDLEFWRMAASLVAAQHADYGSDATCLVLKRRQIEGSEEDQDKAVATCLDGLSKPGQVIAFLLEILLVDCVADYRYQPDDIKIVLEHFGLSMRSFKARARAEMKKGQEPAAATAETPADEPEADSEEEEVA